MTDWNSMAPIGASAASHAATGEAGGGRYLAFDLGGETFAVDVGRVEVVLEAVPITRVPKAPAHLRGVINHRGSVIPVADLGIRFGRGRSASGEGTSVIVLRIRYGEDEVTIGILADAVHEVIAIDSSRIERPPRTGGGADDALIAGIATRDDSFVVILDIDRAFSAVESLAERGAEPA